MEALKLLLSHVQHKTSLEISIQRKLHVVSSFMCLTSI